MKLLVVDLVKGCKCDLKRIADAKRKSKRRAVSMTNYGQNIIRFKDKCYIVHKEFYQNNPSMNILDVLEQIYYGQTNILFWDIEETWC